jgi:phospholipid/cholesterol/gamma-HCH transport system substrate-binding protein
MERHANYVLIGIAALLVLVAALAFVIWFGQLDFARDRDRYRVVFQGPVSGLSVGGEVQFNGIPVGRIERIRLDRSDPNRVFTDIQVDEGTPILVDSRASMEAQNISGIRVIQIRPGTAGGPLLRDISRDERPVISSEPGALSSLLHAGGQAVDEAIQALARLNRLLSDRTVANMQASIEDLRVTMDEIAANRAMIPNAASAIDRLNRATGSIDAAATSVRRAADGDGRRTLAEIAATAEELRTAIREARGAIASINAQSDALGTTTLPNVDATMLSLQQTSDDLDQLVRELRQNPRNLLGRDRGREREVPR